MDPVERMVHRVLLAGVAVSVVLLIAGVVMAVVRGGGLPRSVVPTPGLGHALVAFQPAAYLSLGLIVLIVTPFVRVAGSLIAFAREHDRRYVAVTAVVLVIMCCSVLVGRL